MKYYFIVNPHSGKKDSSPDIETAIESYFSKNGGEYEVVVTEGPENETHMVRSICEANASNPIRICACGGDGTLNGVAGAVVGHNNVEIGYYPAGSGNDFIKCFGTADEFRSIENFVSWGSKPVDIISVNDAYCLNLLSVGVDADVNYAIPKYRRIPLLGGPMAYNIAVLENFFKPMGKKLRIILDDQKIDGEFMLIALGNGRVYGGGYYATPEADYGDGLIDVVLIDKISKLKVASVIGIYKKGEHIKDGEVTEAVRKFARFFHAKKAIIESEKEIVVNIDGEVYMTDRLEVGIIPGAVHFISPQ